MKNIEDNMYGDNVRKDEKLTDNFDSAEREKEVAK